MTWPASSLSTISHLRAAIVNAWKLVTPCLREVNGNGPVKRSNQCQASLVSWRCDAGDLASCLCDMLTCRVTQHVEALRRYELKSDKYIRLCCPSFYEHFPSLSSILPLAFYFSYAMGQRFQAFIIACIGKCYRTLAVIHNQWLFELAAVKQCLLTMKILSAAGNLPGIRRELKSAESKPDGYWPTKRNKIRRRPCK